MRSMQPDVAMSSCTRTNLRAITLGIDSNRSCARFTDSYHDRVPFVFFRIGCERMIENLWSPAQRSRFPVHYFGNLQTENGEACRANRDQQIAPFQFGE